MPLGPVITPDGTNVLRHRTGSLQRLSVRLSASARVCLTLPFSAHTHTHARTHRRARAHTRATHVYRCTHKRICIIISNTVVVFFFFMKQAKTHAECGFGVLCTDCAERA